MGEEKLQKGEKQYEKQFTSSLNRGKEGHWQNQGKERNWQNRGKELPRIELRTPYREKNGMLQKKSFRILHVDRIRKVVIHLGIRKIGIRIQDEKIVSKMT